MGAGMTRTDKWTILIVASFCLLLLAGMLLPALARSREESRRQRCARNLETIAKSLYAYRSDNNGYFPFSWGPSGSAPHEFNNAADSSLGLLHPKYLRDAQLFHCPSTDDAPAFVRGESGTNATYTLQASSYLYDPRIAPWHWSGKTVVMGDLAEPFYDGSMDRGPLSYHDRSANVLFADGHVEWTNNAFCSRNRNDNIYTEDPWDADTDAYLVRGDTNNLKASFDDYDHLK